MPTPDPIGGPEVGYVPVPVGVVGVGVVGVGAVLVAQCFDEKIVQT
jgi:hypothetical protein